MENFTKLALHGMKKTQSASCDIVDEKKSLSDYTTSQNVERRDPKKAEIQRRFPKG